MASGRTSEELQGVHGLGSQKTEYPMDYAPEVLESFVNKHPGNDYFVKFNFVLFTFIIFFIFIFVKLSIYNFIKNLK